MPTEEEQLAGAENKAFSCTAVRLYSKPTRKQKPEKTQKKSLSFRCWLFRLLLFVAFLSSQLLRRRLYGLCAAQISNQSEGATEAPGA